MEFTAPKFIVPSTLTFYDSKVQREIGFIYGLDKSNINTTINKYVAGRFNNNNIEQFFVFKNSEGTVFNPFMDNYPEAKSYTATTNLYNLTKKVDDVILYYSGYNNGKIQFTCNINKAVWFFTDYAASIVKQAIGGNTLDISPSTVVIKHLVNNGVSFPCSSFVMDNIKDYIS